MSVRESSVGPDVHAWLREQAGAYTLLERPGATDAGEASGRRLWRLDTTRWGRVVVKVEPRPQAWRAEVRAYERWIPKMQGRAARLLAHDEDLSAIVLTELPGEEPVLAGFPVYRRAGRLLRMLHQTMPERHREGSPGAAAQAQRLLVAARDHVSQEERDFVERRAAMLVEEPETRAVPTHGDYRPRNWLLGPHGTLRVLDFGASGWAPASVDFALLAHGPWQRRPKTRQAFLRGYGRELTDREEQAVVSRGSLLALREIERGSRLGLPAVQRRGHDRMRRLMRETAAASHHE
ncbi:aminoglycoside phosphotransferase family protein [Nocardioidaceae bacterium]|nr:aminoglycoside phosphotransferase family protein [Nocardioidaceae bacterium]